MKIDFVVHSAVSCQIGTDAVVDGEKMHASVQGLEVELTTVTPRHGTLTLRFAGKELPEAMAMFTPDKKITFEAK